MLGPIVKGDKSILEHDLTHATSGLSLYPAFDTGWTEGVGVLAPEPVTITRHSGGSESGWSLYATGESKLRYYITHLRSGRAAVGAKVPKGGWLGNVGNFVGARVPHAHVGINVELLLGAGKQLKHNTNYTHGQPTIGAQLAGFLEEEDMPPWFPGWWEWRLLDGRPETRPADAPDMIPQKYLDLVKVAERYGTKRVASVSAEVASLKSKLTQIHTLST